jgi:hypothetical protein
MDVKWLLQKQSNGTLLQLSEISRDYYMCKFSILKIKEIK